MTPIKTHRYPEEGPMRGLLRSEISVADSVHPLSQGKSSEHDENIVVMRVVRGGGFEPFAIGDRSDITKLLRRHDPARWPEER